MKKIGILFGMEDTFPHAFVERVNQKAEKGIMAEPVRIDKVMQNQLTEYAVIIDRISQDVPFYRAYLKNAALTGTAVINNPFGGVRMINFLTIALRILWAFRFQKRLFCLQLSILTTLQLSPSEIWWLRWIGRESSIMLVFRPI